MDHQQPPATKRRSRIRLIIQAVFSLALVVVLFYYLLKDVNLAQVWAEIQAMTWTEDAALAAIAAWNLATYGLLWMSVTPGLRFGRAMVMTQAASAVTNTVPTVGPAIGVGMTYSMLRSWGYSGSRISVAVLVSGVWNTFAKLALPVLALALLALQGNASGARLTLALAGIATLVAAIVVFALLLRSEQLAERFGLLAGRVASRLLRLIHRPPVQGWELATVRFRTRTLELLEHGWGPITAATLVSHLSLYLVLLACLRAVGVSDAEVSWVQVLVAFAFMRLVTIVPFTPGSAGVAVLGLMILLATMPMIHQHRIGVREADLFRLLNDLALPGWTKWPVWGVMQLGVIGAVLPVAALALLTKRIRLAAYAALAAGTIYLIAKLVKVFVQRGRPQTLLPNGSAPPSRPMGSTRPTWPPCRVRIAVRPATWSQATPTRSCSSRSSPASAATATCYTGPGPGWPIAAGPHRGWAMRSPRSNMRRRWGCWPPSPGSGSQRCCWCGPLATAPACWSSSACRAAT